MARILQIVILLVLLAESSSAFAQNTFQKVIPGAWNTWGTCAKNSSEGRLTFCTWTHDQSGTTGRDILMISMNGQGDTLWTRAYGGPYDDQSFSLITTSDGGYLIAGTTDTIAGGSASWRSYVLRTNEQGDTLWTRAISGLGYTLALSECDDGGFLVVGMPGLRMVRLDPQGDLTWHRLYDRHDPPDFDSQLDASCVSRSTDNNYFVGGRLSSGAMFLSKVSSSGGVLWTKVSSMESEVRQVEATPDGGLILVGYLLSTVAPGWDGVVARMDSLGNTLWSKAYDTGTTNGFNSGIRTSEGTYLWIGGSERSPLNHDVHLLKTDSLGNPLFSQTFGDTFTDYGLSAAEAISDCYFIVARTSNPESGTSTWVIKTDSTGAGDCLRDSITTIATDVDLGWWDYSLESFSIDCAEYSTGFNVRRGTTILPLCPVGVLEQDSAELIIHLSPNPARDQFTIAIGSTDNWNSEIEIFNTLGGRVMSSKVNKSHVPIDCSSLPRGMYLVRVTTSTRTRTERLILE